MKSYASNLPAMILIGACLFFMSFIPSDSNKKPWDIPANYLELKNPQAADDAAMIKTGKILYVKNCKSCHGNFGKGDGPRARAIETGMWDFSAADFQAQSDGAIYYQSIVGRDEMPNYEKKITAEKDRWALITYIRTLN